MLRHEAKQNSRMLHQTASPCQLNSCFLVISKRVAISELKNTTCKLCSHGIVLPRLWRRKVVVLLKSYKYHEIIRRLCCEKLLRHKIRLGCIKPRTTLEPRTLCFHSYEQQCLFKHSDRCSCSDSEFSCFVRHKDFRPHEQHMRGITQKKHHSISSRTLMFTRRSDQDLQDKAIYAEHDTGQQHTRTHLVWMAVVSLLLTLLLFQLSGCYILFKELAMFKGRISERKTNQSD